MLRPWLAATLPVLLLAGAPAAQAATGTIATVAGDGTPAFSGDGGAASGARLSTPVEVTVHPGGGYLIADQGNQRVRRVAADGTIATVAGDGTAGFQGDGGPAGSARLDGPSGVAVLPDGSLLIADANNNRVRRVGPDGTIVTVAGGGGALGDGGPATAAGLAFPYDIAVAADGSYLVADVDNNRIRRVTSGGTISTIAGGGAGGDGGPATGAALSDPSGVAFAADGAVLIADTENDRIRRVGTDGTITTVAGTGTPGYQGDGGAAVAARLDAPIRVLPAADGSFLIAERDNHVIRRVAVDGTIATIAGDGTPGFAGDGGSARAAKLNRPFGLAVSADDDILLTDAANHRVRLVDAGDASLAPPPPPDSTPSAPPPPPAPPPRPPLAAFAAVAGNPVLKDGTTFDASASSVPGGGTIQTYDWNVDRDPEPEVSCAAGQSMMTAVFPRTGSTRATGPPRIQLTVTAAGGTGRASLAGPIASSPLVKTPVFSCQQPRPDLFKLLCTRRIVFSIVEVTATGADKCFQLRRDGEYVLGLTSPKENLDRLLGRLPTPVLDKDKPSITATVEGPVSVNGLPLPLPSALKTAYDLGNNTLGLGRVPVEIPVPGADKPVRLTELDLNKKVVPDPTGRFSLGSAKAETPGIKALGGLKLGGGAEFALRSAFKSELKLSLTLPSIFTGIREKNVSGAVTVLGDNTNGFAFQGARVQVPYAYLGPIALEKLFFAYQRTNQEFIGGFDVQLLPGFGPKILASPEDGYGLQLRNGSFFAGGFGIEFPVAPQVFPGVGINNVGANFGVDPLRLTGRIGLAFGETVAIDGTAFLALASKDTPFDFPAEFAPPGLGFLAGRRLDSFSAAIGATASLKLPVFGKTKLTDAHVFYAHPGLVEFGGGLDFGYKDKIVELSLTGKIDGFLDTEAELFSVEGGIKGCVKLDLGFPLSSIKPCLTAGGVVSSKGAGFCGIAILPFPFPPVPIPVGGGKEWKGGASVQVFSCDYGPYREENVRAAGQRVGKAAQAGETVTLPGGLAGSMIRVSGRGGAPRVTVTPPRGEPIALPQADTPAANRDVVSFVGEDGVTTVALRKPAAGTWRIGTQAGSPPITKVATAESLPPPKVRARIAGSGAGRTLSYEIADAPGQTVTFVERGRRTYRRIGDARGTRGTLRFTPADGAAEQRRILALVERGGVVKTLRVARYAAAGTLRPGKPARLRARRAGSTISVSFAPVRGAERYRVAWQPRIGVPTSTVTRSPRAKLLDVDRLIPGTVTVSALKLDAQPGVPARARIRTPVRRAARR